MSPEQLQYETYHSPEQRAARTLAARQAAEIAVSEAHRLFFDGQPDRAEHVLSLAGFAADGIAYYLSTWGAYEEEVSDATTGPRMRSGW